MPSDNGTTASRSPGRPVSIDADAIAALALKMFAERGFEQTSMEDIAREAGVGRKSLYRYFANKAELVWGGMGPVVEASRHVLESLPATDQLSNKVILEGLSNAVTTGITTLPDITVTRGRLRLILEHPELMHRSYDFLGARREQIHAYLTDRGVPGETARYLCAALIGATFEAWLQWAASEDADPAPYIRRALDVLCIRDG